MNVIDRFERPLRSLRISVTDRCNLRCQYCMPETDYVWLPRESLLTFEEITTLVDLFTAAGARRAFASVNLDTVVIRGGNDDELVPLLDYARSIDAEIRFIEYMDVGGATRWSMDEVVPRAEMLARIEAHYGPVEALKEMSS